MIWHIFMFCKVNWYVALIHSDYLTQQLSIFLPKGMVVIIEQLTSELDWEHYVKNYSQIKRAQV